MKKYKIIYWVATSIIILVIGLGSFADILMIDAMRQSITQHGFPVHFLPYFGLTKLAATVVLLVPAFRRYKEVAYGGLFFYFVGAVYSHIAIGDGIEATMGALIALIIVVVSYFAWLKMTSATEERGQISPSYTG